MKKTQPISESKALNIFKKIGNFLETDEAHQQVRTPTSAWNYFRDEIKGSF